MLGKSDSDMTNVLFLGDIVGHPARVAITRHLNELRELHKLDLVVANAENAAGGSGITAAIASELTALTGVEQPVYEIPTVGPGGPKVPATAQVSLPGSQPSGKKFLHNLIYFS